MIMVDFLKAYYNLLVYPKYPLMYIVYLNNFCNLRCSFCEIGQQNSSGDVNKINAELSKGQIDSLIRICIKSGCRRVYLTGGEPLMSKNLWYLLEKCLENKVIVDGITTNGTLLNNLSSREIGLINATTRDIVISIDSANDSEHDTSRGVAGTLQKIRMFFTAGSKKDAYKCNFSFNVVVHSKNMTSLKNIIALGIVWKIRHINFQPLSPETIFVDMKTTQSKKELIEGLDLDYFQVQVDKLIKYSEENNISTDLRVFKLWVPYYFRFLYSKEIFFNKLPFKFLCSKIFNYVHINYHGDFLPCSNLGSFANIEEKDCFKKWQKNGQRVKKMFSKGQYFDKCHFCFCDFPTSFRISLIYFPIRNFSTLIKLAGYYLDRIKDKSFKRR